MQDPVDFQWDAEVAQARADHAYDMAQLARELRQEEFEETHTIQCGHCLSRHQTAAEVWDCAQRGGDWS